MARSVGRIVLAGTLTLLALAVATVLARVWLVQQAADQALAAFGPQPASLTVVRVGLGELEVRNVWIGAVDGPGAGARQVTLRLAWFGDTPVAVRQVEVTHGNLRGVLQDGHVSFGPLDRFVLADEAEGGVPAEAAMESGLPDLSSLPEIAVEGLRLRLDGPAGTAEIGLGERIVLAGGLLKGASPIHFIGPGVSGKGRLEGRARADGQASVSLVLDALAVEPPWLPVPVRLAALALDAEVQPGFATADLRLRAPELGVAADLSVAAAAPFSRPPVDARIRLDVERIAAIQPLWPALPVRDGRLRLEAALLASVDATSVLAAPLAALRTADGQLEFDIGGDVTGTAGAERIDLETVGRATLGDGRLEVAFERFEGSVAGLDVARLPPDFGPDGIAPLVGREAKLTLGSGFRVTMHDAAAMVGERAADVRLGFAGNLTASSLAELEARIGAGEAALDGFELHDASLSAAGVRLLGNGVETLAFEGDVKVASETAASGRLRIAAARFAHEGIAARGVDVEFSFDARLGEGIDVVLGRPARIAARSLAVDGAGATTRPLDLRVGEAAFRRPVCPGGGCPGGDTTLAFAATLGGFGWRLEGSDQEVALGQATVRLNAAGEGAPVRGRLDLRARDMAAPGLAQAGEAHASGPVDLSRRSFDLGIDVAGLVADPALAGTMPAIGFRGRLAGDPARVTVNGEARAAGLDQLRLAVEARHQVRTGQGEGRVELSPIDLATLPSILEAFGRADADPGAVWGELAGATNLRWDDAIDGDAVILLSAAGIRRDEIAVGGVDLELFLSNLVPPRSDGLQRLSIRRIDAGMPIEGVQTEFRLLDRNGPVAEIESMTGEVMGGRFSLRPLRLSAADAGTQRLDFDLQGIDLGQLADLIAMEGVELAGSVSGHLPVAIEDASRIAVPGARLSGDGPGLIRLTSKTAREALAGRGGRQLDLVLQALEDYHFQALDVTIDKAFDGEAEMRVGVKGSNPAVYEGHPIHLNVSVTGNADRLLGTILTVYRTSSGAVQRGVEALR